MPSELRRDGRRRLNGGVDVRTASPVSAGLDEEVEASSWGDPWLLRELALPFEPSERRRGRGRVCDRRCPPTLGGRPGLGESSAASCSSRTSSGTSSSMGSPPKVTPARAPAGRVRGRESEVGVATSEVTMAVRPVTGSALQRGQRRTWPRCSRHSHLSMPVRGT